VIYDGMDPQSPGFLLVRVFSPDDSEFAEIRYQLPDTRAERRDFLYDTARAYGNRAGNGDSAWPAYDFREAFNHGGVKTSLRRMVRESQAELIGSQFEVPGQGLDAPQYVHIIYKHNSSTPTDGTMSVPKGIRDAQLSTYAVASAGRRQIMTTFMLHRAGERPAPTFTGRWDGTDGSGLALDVNGDGTFVSLYHPDRGVYTERARGSYGVLGRTVVLRYVHPAVRAETCMDYSLTRDELAGTDVLVLCGQHYRK
jgi:hypothetical protein